MSAKRGRAGDRKKDNAAARLCFLNYLAFLRLSADQSDSALPWADSSIQKNVRKKASAPASSPVSDQDALRRWLKSVGRAAKLWP
jgi:hypothetical protein